MKTRGDDAVSVRHYSELIAWQRAMDLVVQVYRVTDGFPTGERFGLTNQLRRAAVSVPSNIAEGQGRHTTRDFLRCLAIAYGSLQEVETQCIIALRLGYIPEHPQAAILDLAGEVGRLINGLRNALSQRPKDTGY